MAKARLIVYDDSAVYGGHEVMAQQAIIGLASSGEYELDVFVSEANATLRQKMEAVRAEHGHLALHLLPYASQKLQSVRNYFAQQRVTELAARFRGCQAQGVLAIQGDIEISSLAFSAARRAELPVWSYIPVPHSLREMGAKLGCLRDQFNAPLWKKPQAYITISHAMADLLQRRGVTQPIEIVFNGIDVERFAPRDGAMVRSELDLPVEVTLLGMVGRIEWVQKQQNFLLEVLAQQPEEMAGVELVYVGDGPDREALEALARDRGLEKRVHFLRWLADPSAIYSAFDFTVIASRFEGVPLVMLESLCSGTPVLASDRDGMKELLPSSWLFEPGDALSFLATWRRVRTGVEAAALTGLQRRVSTEMTTEVFRENFHRAVAKLMV